MSNMNAYARIGLEFPVSYDIYAQMDGLQDDGFDFAVTPLVHPRFSRYKDVERYKVFAMSDQVIGNLKRLYTNWKKHIRYRIDCSVKDMESVHLIVRDHAEDLLHQELEFVNYYDPYFVLLNLNWSPCANFARTIYSCATKNPFTSYCIKVLTTPDDLNQFRQDSSEREEKEDTWDWWNQFRTVTKDASNIQLALQINSTSCEEQQLIRWLGEPLICVFLPTHVFQTNRAGFPILNKTLRNFVMKVVSKNVDLVITGANRHQKYITYVQYLQNLTLLAKQNQIFFHNEQFDVVPKVPMQILSNDLTANIYNSFEKDSVKYKKYQEAIHKALIDRVPTGDVETVLTTIMVLGAGRGPLVKASILAAAETKRKIQIIAVEKNKGAINDLLHKRDNEWKDYDVTVIAADMRTWTSSIKADIMVSDLLGSFGDNELSPECLYAAQRNLRENGICIPCEYNSHLGIVMTQSLYDQVQELHSMNKFQQPYTFYHKSYFEISPPQKLFKFVHPCRPEDISYQRYSRLLFSVKQDCVLHGLVGYFDARLYSDITLSTCPHDLTPGLISWFAIYFPISTPLQLKSGFPLEVNFWRQCDEEKVWYEWLISKPVQLYIHNINACAHSMKKTIDC